VQELQQDAAEASRASKSLGKAAFLLQGHMGAQAQVQRELWNFVKGPAGSCREVRHWESSSLVPAENLAGVRLAPLKGTRCQIPSPGLANTMDECRSIPPMVAESPSRHDGEGWPPSPIAAFSRGHRRHGSLQWSSKQPSALVVEDDRTCLRIGSKFLAQMGCRVETAVRTALPAHVYISP